VQGFTAWGVKIYTPTAAYEAMTNYLGAPYSTVNAKNTDGIDPASSGQITSNPGNPGKLTDDASNILVAYTSIRTGDDNMAIKGGTAPVNGCTYNVTVAHSHFYEGHGMSIGSESSGSDNGVANPDVTPVGGVYPSVSNVNVYDLTIDGADNGLRIKSDWSRGGLVSNIRYSNVCIRTGTQTSNPQALIFSPYYSPTKSAGLYPNLQGIALEGVRIVNASGYTFQGFNSASPILLGSGWSAGTVGFPSPAVVNPLLISLNNVVTDAAPLNMTVADAQFSIGAGGTSLPLQAGSGVTVTGAAAGANVAPSIAAWFSCLSPEDDGMAGVGADAHRCHARRAMLAMRWHGSYWCLDTFSRVRAAKNNTETPMNLPRATANDADIARRFDLRSLDASFHADPYPVYHALRTHEPVKRMPDGSLFLTRFRDVQAVYRDPKTFSSDKKVEFAPKYGATPLFEHHTTSLVFNDPPLHTRVRKLIAGALTARAIAAMEEGLIRLVDGLLDRAAARGEIDLIGDFAAAIPVEVIGNLLDVPHDEREPLRDWSLAILGALEPALTPAQRERGNRAVTEFVAYLKDLVARRRAAPGDPQHDVLTRLIQGEAGGEQLSEVELLQNCIFILNAGHETTTNLIGNGLVTLSDWTGERDALLREPDLLDSAVEECLRFESSNQLGNRMTMFDTEIGGVPVARGTPVTLCIGAANRDPEQFPDPDRFDIRRTPNRHLAFGFGIHQCAGLSLARLEARIAIGRFVRRFPAYRISGEPTRGGRVRFRGYAAVPCAVT
jgi:cytochrome P450